MANRTKIKETTTKKNEESHGQKLRKANEQLIIKQGHTEHQWKKIRAIKTCNESLQ